jgi:antibiotic biosynthesis monooxygenase (ABM) superfamily enzyme
VTEPDPGEPRGVTVVVRRTIRRDAADSFETWLRGINDAAAAFPGHGGVEVVRPAAGNQDWVVIFRFDTADHLAGWETSTECRTWLAEAEPLTLSHSIERVTGLEYWFSLPRDAAHRPPPPWKMALVTLVGLYPLVHWAAPAINRRLEMLPGPVATGVTVAILVAAMTWVVMPVLVRALRPWLFRRATG